MADTGPQTVGHRNERSPPPGNAGGGSKAFESLASTSWPGLPPGGR